jgi:hypothetical protein
MSTLLPYVDTNLGAKNWSNISLVHMVAPKDDGTQEEYVVDAEPVDDDTPTAVAGPMFQNRIGGPKRISASGLKT